LTDESLLSETRSIARSERERTAWLVAHLAEVYRRNLALQRGFSSVTHYARSELGLTDAMAWDSVRAAQLALELPEVVERIATGELNLSSAGELWRVLQEEKKSAASRSNPRPSTKPESALQPDFEMGPSPEQSETKPA